MNKTIYVRDEDVATWDKAKELAGEKLSPIIAAALKKFVTEQEAETKGFERIVVTYDDSTANYLPRAKAFYGRWIIPQDKPYKTSSDDGSEYHYYAVAVTAKKNVVTFTYKEDGESQWAHKLSIFPSFEQAACVNEVASGIREAIRRIGVPVEELDI